MVHEPRQVPFRPGVDSSVSVQSHEVVIIFGWPSLEPRPDNSEKLLLTGQTSSQHIIVNVRRVGWHSDGL
jgi:hypothetical protein